MFCATESTDQPSGDLPSKILACNIAQLRALKYLDQSHCSYSTRLEDIIPQACLHLSCVTCTFDHHARCGFDSSEQRCRTARRSKHDDRHRSQWHATAAGPSPSTQPVHGVCAGGGHAAAAATTSPLLSDQQQLPDQADAGHAGHHYHNPGWSCPGVGRSHWIQQR
jgi:hypothetical protein